MSHLGALRVFLEQRFPHTVAEMPQCTCGATNHARICFFRVEALPAVAVIPEGMRLTRDDVQQALGCGAVEPLEESELDEVCSDSELGRMEPFENPFGTTALFDESLLPCTDLVFCPRMFFSLVHPRPTEERSQCFRVPTREFLELTHAIVLPLTAAGRGEPDYWAV